MSANRKVSCRVYDSTSNKLLFEENKFSNCTINFFGAKTTDAFLKSFASHLRLCPEDPELVVDRLFVVQGAKKQLVELDDVELKAIRSKLLREINSSAASASKFEMHAYVTMASNGETASAAAAAAAMEKPRASSASHRQRRGESENSSPRSSNLQQQEGASAVLSRFASPSKLVGKASAAEGGGSGTYGTPLGRSTTPTAARRAQTPSTASRCLLPVQGPSTKPASVATPATANKKAVVAAVEPPPPLNVQSVVDTSVVATAAAAVVLMAEEPANVSTSIVNVEKVEACAPVATPATATTSALASTSDATVAFAAEEEDCVESLTWREIPGINSPIPDVNTHKPFAEVDLEQLLPVEKAHAALPPPLSSSSSSSSLVEEEVLTGFEKSDDAPLLLPPPPVHAATTPTPVATSTHHKSTRKGSLAPPFMSPMRACATTPIRARGGVVAAAPSADDSNNSNSTGPLFPSGMTSAEAALAFDSTMRSYGPSGTLVHANHHHHTQRGAASPMRSNTKRSQTPVKGNGKQHHHGGDLSIDAHTAATLQRIQAEGRPSLATMCEQYDFMKQELVHNDGEELEWLMQGNQDGAYAVAHAKHEKAMDRYFKALYDAEVNTKKVQALTGASAVLPPILSAIVATNDALKINDSDKEALIVLEEQMKRLMAILASSETAAAGEVYSKHCLDMMKSIAQDIERAIRVDGKKEKGAASKAIKAANTLARILPEDVKSAQALLANAKKTENSSLDDSEKWSRRERECKDYHQQMATIDALWLQREAGANAVALSSMRSLMPVNINSLGAQELCVKAKELGGLLTLELATELKSNKLLQWIITDPKDIARANFLTGPSATCFEAIESLDIVEMRAIAACLPVRFELDGDGRKEEWRERFMGRAKLLVQQEQGEQVKGGWDGTTNRRAMITLQPLKPEQKRRKVYYYKTFAECEARKADYVSKAQLKEKKQLLLTKATAAHADAKIEYDIILEESRDAAMKTQYGADKLLQAKEQAKSEMVNAEQNKKRLQTELNQLVATIASWPLTLEQYVESCSELCDFLLARDVDWKSSEAPRELIEGPFEAFPESLASLLGSGSSGATGSETSGGGAKFCGAEEDAARRKHELSMLVRGGGVTVSSSDSTTNVISSQEQHAGEASDAVATRDNVISSDSNSSTSVSTCAVATPSKTPRRNSVLTSVNPQLLATLDKIMASGSKAPQLLTPGSVCRRTSLASVATPVVSSAPATSTEEEKSAPRSTRSKLLQKLLERELPAQPAARFNPFAVSGGGGGSFLDQIKARAAKKEEANSSAATFAPLSLMAQIAMRRKEEE